MTVIQKVVIAVGVVLATAILVAVGGYVYLMYGFGNLGYDSRKRCDMILEAWKSYKELDALEIDAISLMKSELNREGRPEFNVPFGDTSTYISRDENRYLIEYAGGLHHFGVIIFREIKMADEEMRPTVNPGYNTRVSQRIVFYEE